MAGSVKDISTHVLDTSSGSPAAGIRVRLEIRNGAEWTRVGDGRTDGDGRCGELLSGTLLVAAAYRLIFETAPYFESRSIAFLYPEVTITFVVRNADMHYHIPLLLGPNTYTTYRGS